MVNIPVTVSSIAAFTSSLRPASSVSGTGNTPALVYHYQDGDRTVHDNPNIFVGVQVWNNCSHPLYVWDHDASIQDVITIAPQTGFGKRMRNGPVTGLQSLRISNTTDGPFTYEGPTGIIYYRYNETDSAVEVEIKMDVATIDPFGNEPTQSLATLASACDENKPNSRNVVEQKFDVRPYLPYYPERFTCPDGKKILYLEYLTTLLVCYKMH